MTDTLPFPVCAAPGSIQGRFERFHNDHPEVYTALVRLAREWRHNHGDRPVGIGMLYEVVRWEMSTRPDLTEQFKLNNVYRSRYARLILESEPDLADVFNLRELSAP